MDRIFRLHHARGILGIRFLAQKQYCTVGLGFIGQHVTETGSLSQADRKYALRRRVQGSGVTDFFHAQDPTQLRYHIVGGKAFFLVYIDDSVH